MPVVRRLPSFRLLLRLSHAAFVTHNRPNSSPCFEENYFSNLRTPIPRNNVEFRAVTVLSSSFWYYSYRRTSGRVNPLNILKIIPLRLPFSTAPEIKCMYRLPWPFPFAYSVTMCYANFTLRSFHTSHAKLPTSQSKFCASNKNAQIHFGHTNPAAYQTHPIYFFLELPRSRCYGRTAALRLILQPCDEDD